MCLWWFLPSLRSLGLSSTVLSLQPSLMSSLVRQELGECSSEISKINSHLQEIHCLFYFVIFPFVIYFIVFLVYLHIGKNFLLLLKEFLFLYPNNQSFRSVYYYEYFPLSHEVCRYAAFFINAIGKLI